MPDNDKRSKKNILQIHLRERGFVVESDASGHII
jgi:hypothetical protein